MLNHLDALKDAKLGPVWHDPLIMPDVLPSLKEDITCELLIVGGGFTGLWAAIQLLERQPETKIILIEKTFVGDGASGRCGGFLSTALAHGQTNTEHRFPNESERLDKLGEDNMREFLDTLDRHGIDVHYEHTGSTSVALHPESAKKLNEIYKQALAEGEEVVWYDKDSLKTQVDSPLFHAGLWFKDGDGIVHPGRLCWGLKEIALKLGLKIYESTSLVKLEPVGKDSMKAHCENGVISSEKILMATNAFRNPIGRARRSIVPVWDYQIATEPLSDEQIKNISWGSPSSRHALSDYSNMFHYFRLTKDNRITWGGGGAVRYYFNNGTEKKFEHAPPRYEQLAKAFFEFFPQLEGIKFSHKWGGIIATSTRFCMVPGLAYNGRVAWSIGYTGLGVGASRFGARVGIELLGYQPSDILKMKFITQSVLPWAPEPFRWVGVRLTQMALIKADNNGGKRGLWLKFLDMLGLGFTC